MDGYARRWEKGEQSGYSPAYEFNWDEFMAHKRRAGSIKDFENKKLLPLTAEVIKKHLLGLLVVGVYPILPDNSTHFSLLILTEKTGKKRRPFSLMFVVYRTGSISSVLVQAAAVMCGYSSQIHTHVTEAGDLDLN